MAEMKMSGGRGRETGAEGHAVSRSCVAGMVKRAHSANLFEGLPRGLKPSRLTFPRFGISALWIDRDAHASNHNLENRILVMRIVFIAALCLIVAACSPAGDEEAETLASIVADEVTAVMEAQGFASVSAVLVTGDTHHIAHFGVLSDGRAPDNATLYDIGSITKTHTGLILAQAVGDGLIGLDDPVSDYLPGVQAAVFEREGVAATIRHLATHVSGMPQDLACAAPDMPPQARLDCFMAHDEADLRARLTDMALLDTPGSQYRYSNPGIRLLGYILEDVYDAPFEVLLERLVFARTGQVETLFSLNAEQYARWQIGSHENGLPVPDASGYFNPAGGLKSTAPDIARYLAFYLDDENALASRALTLLVGQSAGLGRAYVWNSFQLDTEGQYYHSGGTFGTSAWSSIYPRENLGIFLVTPYVSATAQGDLNGAANRIIARVRTLQR